MRLRKTNLDDLPQLKALWALGFGDTEQEIEAFFAISYPAATGFCAEEDGRLIAVPVGERRVRSVPADFLVPGPAGRLVVLPFGTHMVNLTDPGRSTTVLESLLLDAESLS